MKKMIAILGLLLTSSTVFADPVIESLMSRVEDVRTIQVRGCSKVSTGYATAKAQNEAITFYSQGRERTNAETKMLQVNEKLMSELETIYNNCLIGEFKK